MLLKPKQKVAKIRSVIVMLRKIIEDTILMLGKISVKLENHLKVLVAVRLD